MSTARRADQVDGRAAEGQEVAARPRHVYHAKTPVAPDHAERRRRDHRPALARRDDARRPRGRRRRRRRRSRGWCASRWCTAPPAARRFRDQAEPVGASRRRARLRSRHRPVSSRSSRSATTSRSSAIPIAPMPSRSTAREIGGDHFRSSAVFLTQAHPKRRPTAPGSRRGFRSISSMRSALVRPRRFRRCSSASRL